MPVSTAQESSHKDSPSHGQTQKGPAQQTSSPQATSPLEVAPVVSLSPQTQLVQSGETSLSAALFPTSSERSDSPTRPMGRNTMMEVGGSHLFTGGPVLTGSFDMAELEKFSIGDKVSVGSDEGVVMFKGRTKFADGPWLGIKLDQPVGKNDGRVKGTRYFQCEPNRGLFVRPSNCILAIDAHDAQNELLMRVDRNNDSRPSALKNGFDHDAQKELLLRAERNKKNKLDANRRDSMHSVALSENPGESSLASQRLIDGASSRKKEAADSPLPVSLSRSSSLLPSAGRRNQRKRSQLQLQDGESGEGMAENAFLSEEFLRSEEGNALRNLYSKYNMSLKDLKEVKHAFDLNGVASIQEFKSVLNNILKDFGEANHQLAKTREEFSALLSEISTSRTEFAEARRELSSTCSELVEKCEILQGARNTLSNSEIEASSSPPTQEQPIVQPSAQRMNHALDVQISPDQSPSPSVEKFDWSTTLTTDELSQQSGEDIRKSIDSGELKRILNSAVKKILKESADSRQDFAQSRRELEKSLQDIRSSIQTAFKGIPNSNPIESDIYHAGGRAIPKNNGILQFLVSSTTSYENYVDKLFRSAGPKSGDALNKKEMRLALQNMGFTPEVDDLNELFVELETDRNGKLASGELHRCVQDMMEAGDTGNGNSDGELLYPCLLECPPVVAGARTCMFASRAKLEYHMAHECPRRRVNFVAELSIPRAHKGPLSLRCDKQVEGGQLRSIEIQYQMLQDALFAWSPEAIQAAINEGLSSENTTLEIRHACENRMRSLQESRKQMQAILERKLVSIDFDLGRLEVKSVRFEGRKAPDHTAKVLDRTAVDKCLTDVATVLKTYEQKMVLTVQAKDNGDPVYNMKLAENQAHLLVDMLLKHGVRKNLLLGKGVTLRDVGRMPSGGRSKNQADVSPNKTVAAVVSLLLCKDDELGD